MLAAGFGLGLVVGLGLAGLTSTLVGALHVCSERLLAGFYASSEVPRARAPGESADLQAGWLGSLPSQWQPTAARWRPHRKPLKLRLLVLKVLFDCSIAPLLDAGLAGLVLD